MNKVREITARFSVVAPSIGAIILLIGAVNYFSSTKSSSNDEVAVSPAIIERKIAIEEAKRKGEKTYTYTSRFIPGVGVINDPEAYKQDWEKSLKEAE